MLGVGDAAPDTRSRRMLDRAGVLDAIAKRVADDDVAAFMNGGGLLGHLERRNSMLLKRSLEDFAQATSEVVADAGSFHGDTRDRDSVRIAVVR
jgi:hypothetical protein